MEKTNFTNLYADFDRGNVATQHAALRQAARKNFQALPLPTGRTEDWRFTSVAPVVDTPFELPPTDVTIDGKLMPAPSEPQAIRMVFCNGRLVRSLSALSGVLNGCTIGPIAEAKQGSLPLGRIAPDQDNVFTALNTSFLGDGVAVTLADGAALATPIEIVWIAQTAGRPTIHHPRVLIVAGKNARATVVERYVGDGAYFTNSVVEITLADDAVVDHVKLQEESLQAFHIANTQVVQAARSTFTTHYLALGGALVRNEVRVRFDGEHAEATVNGLYLAGDKQHIDNFTVIDHARPNCASHELYKGILNGQAHGVFNGKIFVRKDAQKTDAKQTNKVLLLSDSATIDTKPQLEILADDVKCTHGATVGQLDATQLFYLQSRGIPLEAARRLLTFAFANDIVGRIKIESIRHDLEARIVQ